MSDSAPRRGGTLRLYGPGSMDHLDPASAYYALGHQITRLFARQLFTYPAVKDLKDWRESYDRPVWAHWRDRIQPLLDQAVAPYGYRKGSFPRIMLARMAPGGIIQPHRDNMPAATWPHKVHIPIQTNEGVGFFIEPTVYHFKEGQVVEVNNLGEKLDVQPLRKLKVKRAQLEAEKTS